MYLYDINSREEHEQEQQHLIIVPNYSYKYKPYITYAKFIPTPRSGADKWFIYYLFVSWGKIARVKKS